MHILKPLPYAYDALEPYIDKKTMEIHHTKHHQTYIDKFNKTLESAPELRDVQAEDLLKEINEIPESIREGVRNFGGGHANHVFFWNSMSPNGGTPSEALAEALTESFGSMENFRKDFTNAAVNFFGSGWTWLAKDTSGKLVILSFPNQDTPLSFGYVPLLTIDLWEHAYYLLYQNKRAEYIEKWWNIVNWNEVNSRFLPK